MKQPKYESYQVLVNSTLVIVRLLQVALHTL